MIYKFVLLLCMMDPASEPLEEDVVEIRKEADWPVGCWNCRSWGGMRILADGYAVDTDPEGLLNDWGVWQYFGGTHQVIIVWMESSRVEIIQNDNGKYYHQMSYSFGIGSLIEETKKIGK